MLVVISHNDKHKIGTLENPWAGFGKSIILRTSVWIWVQRTRSFLGAHLTLNDVGSLKEEGRAPGAAWLGPPTHLFFRAMSELGTRALGLSFWPKCPVFHSGHFFERTNKNNLETHVCLSDQFPKPTALEFCPVNHDIWDLVLPRP